MGTKRKAGGKGEKAAGSAVHHRSGTSGVDAPAKPKMKAKDYEREMRVLHGELVALQE